MSTYPAAFMFGSLFGLLVLLAFAAIEKPIDCLITALQILWLRVYVRVVNWRADRAEARRHHDQIDDLLLARSMLAAKRHGLLPRHSVPGEIWMESRRTWEDTH